MVSKCHLLRCPGRDRLRRPNRAERVEATGQAGDDRDDQGEPERSASIAWNRPSPAMGEGESPGTLRGRAAEPRADLEEEGVATPGDALPARDKTDAAAGRASVARWLPFGDASRARRLWKVGAWLLGIVLVVAAVELAGVDVRGWFSDLWDALGQIPMVYLAAGWSLQTVQTALTALGWFFILRAGFPERSVPYRQALAAYATGVALTGSSRRTSGRS